MPAPVRFMRASTAISSTRSFASRESRPRCRHGEYINDRCYLRLRTMRISRFPDELRSPVHGNQHLSIGDINLLVFTVLVTAVLPEAPPSLPSNPCMANRPSPIHTPNRNLRPVELLKLSMTVAASRPAERPPHRVYSQPHPARGMPSLVPDAVRTLSEKPPETVGHCVAGEMPNRRRNRDRPKLT